MSLMRCLSKMHHPNQRLGAVVIIFGTLFLVLNMLISSLSTSPIPFLYYGNSILPQAYGAQVNVRVRITSFSQSTNPDGPFHDSGDYYPTIRIGSNSIEGRSQAIDSASFSPPASFPWTHSAA